MSIGMRELARLLAEHPGPSIARPTLLDIYREQHDGSRSRRRSYTSHANYGGRVGAKISGGSMAARRLQQDLRGLAKAGLIVRDDSTVRIVNRDGLMAYYDDWHSNPES